jgi:hypothetical protein
MSDVSAPAWMYELICTGLVLQMLTLILVVVTFTRVEAMDRRRVEAEGDPENELRAIFGEPPLPPKRR